MENYNEFLFSKAPKDNSLKQQFLRPMCSMEAMSADDFKWSSTFIPYAIQCAVPLSFVFDSNAEFILNLSKRLGIFGRWILEKEIWLRIEAIFNIKIFKDGTSNAEEQRQRLHSAKCSIKSTEAYSEYNLRRIADNSAHENWGRKSILGCWAFHH